MITFRYPKEESIGNPQLFCGRKKELEYFLNWASEIPDKKSKSCALVATKKMGKTAILDRLYNLLFLQQGSVIPFFFSIRERAIWLKDFADHFYRSFLTQYLAFKLNQMEWISAAFSLPKIRKIAEENQSIIPIIFLVSFAPISPIKIFPLLRELRKFLNTKWVIGD